MLNAGKKSPALLVQTVTGLQVSNSPYSLVGCMPITNLLLHHILCYQTVRLITPATSLIKTQYKSTGQGKECKDHPHLMTIQDDSQIHVQHPLTETRGHIAKLLSIQRQWDQGHWGHVPPCTKFYLGGQHPHKYYPGADSGIVQSMKRQHAISQLLQLLNK